MLAARRSISNPMYCAVPGPTLASVTSSGLARAPSINSGPVRRGAVDNDNAWRGEKITKRVQATQRIEIHLSQMRVDENVRWIDEERAAVGRRAWDRLRSADRRRTRSVVCDARHAIPASPL